MVTFTTETKPSEGQPIGFKFAEWVFPAHGGERPRERVTLPDGRQRYASTHTGRYFEGRGVLDPKTDLKLCRWRSVFEWWPIEK